MTSDETQGRDAPSRPEDEGAEVEAALTGPVLSPSLSPMRAAALVVDDEPHIRRALRNALAGEFERVLEAATAAEAVDLAAAHRPDMIILDLGLPDRPGQWVCAELRKWSTAPIIVLSAHLAESEKIRMLDEGADDYVTKPFSPAELLARVRAQLRRAGIEEAMGTGGALTVGDLVIDTGARTVRRDGEDVHLTPTEWELLRAFVRNAGKTLTHRQLFQAVWATSSGDPQQYLRVYVANLRRKLEPDAVRPTLIITEPGVGYRFETGS
jgi:two-component system KDP operon response regulator KdpE